MSTEQKWLFEPAYYLPLSVEEFPEGSFTQNEQYVWRFDNNWGISAVRGPYTKGFKDGLWELAIIQFHKGNTMEFFISFDNPILQDVMGYADRIDINSICQRVSQLRYHGVVGDEDWMSAAEQMYEKWRSDLKFD